MLANRQRLLATDEVEMRQRAKTTAIDGGETMRAVEVRDADGIEIDHLARLWHDGWQDAHARILPAELARHRTFESFRERLAHNLAHTRVSGPLGRAVGFCMVKQAELYQLYVAPEARGSGLAAALLGDGETRLASSGVATAWLACAIGNERAMRFYEKNGWTSRGPMVNELETPDGVYRLEVWRYEKRLRPA
jgi:ribosomal protein S18 acetylase RimI-like enzyme